MEASTLQVQCRMEVCENTSYTGPETSRVKEKVKIKFGGEKISGFKVVQLAVMKDV